MICNSCDGDGVVCGDCDQSEANCECEPTYFGDSETPDERPDFVTCGVCNGEGTVTENIEKDEEEDEDEQQSTWVN